MDFLSKARKLPCAPAPNRDPNEIKGNISLDKKQLAANILAWHVANYPGSRVFGHAELGQLKLAEISIRRTGMGEQTELVGEDEPMEELRKLPLEAQTVNELTVDEGMLNVHGTLAGGCAAHLLDIGTFSPLLILSRHWDRRYRRVDGYEPHLAFSRSPWYTAENGEHVFIHGWTCNFRSIRGL